MVVTAGAGHCPTRDIGEEMRTSRTDETALVFAARAGDGRAVEELLAAHLSLVYTIVHRALGADPDADDVVQETMLRAVRELPKLVNPRSFRAWLASIAVRQISTHQHRQRRRAVRWAPLDALTEDAEADSGFEEAAVLGLELATQRRLLMRARQWLDPENQTLLSLWWLETAGRLTRADLAAALGVSSTHAGVRVQRMRAQLDLGRSIEAAITAVPGCPGLDAMLSGWDGRPGSVWRKRISRHLRSCPICLRAGEALVAPEHLLVGLALIPVPLALATGLLGKITVGGTSTVALTTGQAGLGAHLVHAVAVHPLTLIVATASVVAGTTFVTTQWPPDRVTPPVVIAVPSATPAPPGPTRTPTTPTATAATAATATARPTTAPPPADPVRSLAPGPASLESDDQVGQFVSATQTLGVLSLAGSGSSRTRRERATFEVVAGLADRDCFSFRLADGQYLRHSSWRLRTFADDGSALFRGDATFCPGPGATPGSMVLQSSNYPGWFLHHRGSQLWVDQTNRTQQFLVESSFRVTAPLAD